jgi:hypothetical protein
MPRGRPRIHQTFIICPDCAGPKYQYAKYCNKCKAKGSRNAMFGRNHTEESKQKCREHGICPTRGVVGPAHHSWRPAKNAAAGRAHARTLYPLEPCKICGADAERHHIDENPLNNARENIIFLCRRHHKQVHFGRILLGEVIEYGT